MKKAAVAKQFHATAALECLPARGLAGGDGIPSEQFDPKVAACKRYVEP